MEILGIGGWEFFAIFIIMLVVAGPKRMIQWAYILGTYVAKLKVMWAETAAMLQKEFDAAGVDVKVPTDPPTRQTLNKTIKSAIEPVTRPVQEALDETRNEVTVMRQQIRPSADLKRTVTNGSGTSTTTEKPITPPPTDDAPDFGTWSGGEQSNS